MAGLRLRVYSNFGGGTVFFLRCRSLLLQNVSWFVFTGALCAMHGTCMLAIQCHVCVLCSCACGCVVHYPIGSPITVQSLTNQYQSQALHHTLHDAWFCMRCLRGVLFCDVSCVFSWNGVPCGFGMFLLGAAL